MNASAHYFVDTARIVQSVRTATRHGIAAGNAGGSYYNDCRNANSIGIEMCSVIRNGVYVIPEDDEERRKADPELMAKYHIPVSRVCRHYDVTHKNCPAVGSQSSVVGKIQNHADRGGQDMTEQQTRNIVKAGDCKR